MKPFIKYLLIVSGLISNLAYSLEVVNESGWQIGNGGDSLRIAFASTKQSASTMVLKVKEPSFSASTPKTVIQWVLANQDRLAASILSATHEWTLDEKPTCAWISPEGVAKNSLQFSYPTCRKSIQSFGHASTLLIHEAVHQLGVADETFADQVALSVVEAWSSGRTEWISLPVVNAPAARDLHSAVWTGTEMIVFGGRTNIATFSNGNDGYIFSPSNSTWRAISKVGAPAVNSHSAHWTGESMIIWGGFKKSGIDTYNWQNSGAIWHQSSNSWEMIQNPFGPKETGDFSLSQVPQTSVWTGTELLVWGGVDGLQGRSVSFGAAYNPATKVWRKISEVNAPLRKSGHSAVWTSAGMIIWGGKNAMNVLVGEGAIYNPTTDSWKSMTKANIPYKAEGHSAVWTGSQMIVISGEPSSADLLTRGGVYDVKLDQWVDSPTTEMAMSRSGQSAVWTGNELMVFGGKSRKFMTYFNNILTYQPMSQSWQAKQGQFAPIPRQNQTAIWTGNSLIVWGGSDKNNVVFGDGGIYYP